MAFTATATATPPSSAATPATSFDAVTIPLDGLVSDAGLPAPAPAATPALASDTALADPGTAPTATRAPRAQPAADLEVVVKATPRPKSSSPRVYSSAGTTRSLRGLASWYCNNDGSRGVISACHYQYPDTSAYNAYAAAGPRLRAALGPNWRGKTVLVDGLRVKLVDWCQCYQGQSHEKIIDLYLDVFRRTGSSVTIRW